MSGYWRINASASIRTADERWELALLNSNLTNEFKILDAASYAGTGSGSGGLVSFPADIQGDVTQPGTVALQVTLKY